MLNFKITKPFHRNEICQAQSQKLSYSKFCTLVTLILHYLY
ncbi:hypothetical protein AAJ76_1980002518 [Vairimorpha ceranae]|uniref:Uncharacterized protein n=1 Tax=Vairimorpha ceranae TaxID=40302 RepID=A0A0F9W7Z8_9MICR|nr:hypothetical protein AAJ76_1980002518 [Vairimorpha ceranae]KKO73861.1 hypothetical protein AAJ76_1980002518 [Vairimorpha ceranae]